MTTSEAPVGRRRGGIRRHGQGWQARAVPVLAEPLLELVDVAAAPGLLQGLADREGLGGDAAAFLYVAAVEVGVGKDHGHEEVAAGVAA
jgi:hypothetical protein